MTGSPRWKAFGRTLHLLVFASPVLKHQFYLHPHAADAAVREIAVQEAPSRRAEHAHLRHVNELWVIERVQRFRAKLQATRLTERNRLREVQVEVVAAAGSQSIAADSSAFRVAMELPL